MFGSAPTRSIRVTFTTAAAAIAAGTAVLTVAPHVASADSGPESSGATAVAVAGLNVRSAPSAYAERVGSIAKGTKFTVDCKMNGTDVSGNRRWYKVHGSKNQWVTARYAANVSGVPFACTQGDWAFVTHGTLTVRQGPSRQDKAIGVLQPGREYDSRFETKKGNRVSDGNESSRYWVAVETPNGNRGWVSALYTYEADCCGGPSH